MAEMIDTPNEDGRDNAPERGPTSDVSTESVVEALLFSSDVPLTAKKLAQLLGIGDAGDVKRHIETLNRRYEQSGLSFRIEAIARGYQMLTLSTYDHWLAKLQKARAESRLSPAALETLAIVAYKQPVLRADIEAIRGVSIGDMLGRLRDMNLVKIVGRAEEIGRPLLYGTTTRFLEVFGLNALKDLPKVDEDDPQTVPSLEPTGKSGRSTFRDEVTEGRSDGATQGLGDGSRAESPRPH